jgi:hypothetical protein
MDPDVHTELEATIAARRELGPKHDAELVAGFLDRIDKEIDRRVDERVRELAPRKPRASSLHPGTLGVCIPIVAIAGGIGHTVGLVAAFAALVIVFAISELRR